MATITLGTAANNTLTALVFNPANAPADVATIDQGIKADTGPATAPVGAGYTMPGAFSRSGLLYVPNRGILQALPGDIVAFDPATGFPILISAAAAAGASWVHG